MSGEIVRIAMVYDDEARYSPSAFMSRDPLFAASVGAGRILQWSYSLAKGGDIAKARNEATTKWLDESDAEWLLMLDGDMGYDPDALDLLLASADPHDRPVVGGLCFGYSPTDEMVGEANGLMRFPFPTIYDLADDGTTVGFRVRYHYRPNALLQCFATGAAFLLIHRSICEQIRAADGDNWWTRIMHPRGKSLWGEDVSFCVRVNQQGKPVLVNTRVRTSHWKPNYITEAYYARQLAAEPADEPVDVIVPVLRRPHHAAPFMRSLIASTGLATVWAMLSSDEDAEVEEAWRSAGANVVRCAPGRTTWAHKVNDGYRASSAPWMLFVGSDVAFMPAWWDHALQSARVHDCALVSPNDQLNGNVRNGLLATHVVMRRSYVDELGASWDGPGVVCHEGYKHGGDMEWSRVALLRNQLVACPASVVQHRHFFNGLAEKDEVYALGQKFVGHDVRLYDERLRRFEGKKAA